jgi:hypothetical protein
MIDVNALPPQIEKRCIFCGEPPTEKNKEHVIPKWLIALTGDSKRLWHLGVETNSSDRKPRQFSAQRFQFPACKNCNERYSDLEGRTKGYMVRLLSSGDLTAAEWDDLLDWFDKVRIGLWLGNMMLNKDWPTPAPNFYIDERLGKKDRCVLVYPNRPGFKGLVMSGASDPVFMHKPSTFILAINGLIFLNLSSEFLLSQNMGFPYPRDVSYEDGRVYVDDYIANSEPNFPVFDFQFHPPQIGVYQSILIEAAMKDKSYAALVGSEYTASKINAPHSMKTQICTFGAEGAKFHAPSQEVERLELKEEDMKPSREYYSQLYRYRQYDLEVAKTQFPDRRAFLDFLDQYNLGALEQAQKL